MKKILTTYYPKILIEILDNKTISDPISKNKIEKFLKDIGYDENSILIILEISL